MKRMTHRWLKAGPFGVALLLISWGTAMAAVEGSLLENGDFERGEGSMAWRWIQTSQTPPVRSRAEPHRGEYSLHCRLENEGAEPSEGHLIQEILGGIAPGEEYLLSFWVKEVHRGISYVQQYAVEWYDQRGVRLPGQGLKDFHSNRSKWTRFEVAGLIAPEEAVSARVLFRLVTGALPQGSGEVYLDDIAFRPAVLPPPGKAILSDPVLVWKNGDALPGRMVKIQEGTLHWESPLFQDPVGVSLDALEAIRYPKTPLLERHPFRIVTSSGDNFLADLVGADESSFTMESRLLGSFDVQRNAIYAFDRIDNPNLIFEGSKFSEWGIRQDGPIRKLRYRVYGLSPQRNALENRPEFPPLAEREPVASGQYPAGYLDLSLAQSRQSFAMAFDGEIHLEEEGDYQFRVWADDQAKLFVDGRLVSEFLENGRAPGRGGRRGTIRLTPGPHAIRVEFLQRGGAFRLITEMTSPSGRVQSLVGRIQGALWEAAPQGQLRTHRRRARVFRPVVLPDRFECHLELEATGDLRFVLGFGPTPEDALSDDAPKLVKSGEELLIVQGAFSERVVAVAPDRPRVSLRLSYDATQRLQIFESSGRLLSEWPAVSIGTGKSGVMLQNRGNDLTVRRLDFYRKRDVVNEGAVASDKARVHLVDGRVLYGRLGMRDGAPVVRAEDGNESPLADHAIERVIDPSVNLGLRAKGGEMRYQGGTTLRGELISANGSSVLIRTAFSRAPIEASLRGIEAVILDATPGDRESASEGLDQLFTQAGMLRGQLIFDHRADPFGWRPEGGTATVRLAETGGMRIERSSKHRGEGDVMGGGLYPDRVHLRNGDVFPAKALAFDSHSIRMESPFFSARTLQADALKGIEFSGWRDFDEAEEERRAKAWEEAIGGTVASLTQRGRPGSLERALLVPRAFRQTPSTHIVQAKNGDMRRGTLRSFDASTLEFESRFKPTRIPRQLVVRIVDVRPGGGAHDPQQGEGDDDPFGVATEGIRTVMSDGSVITFLPQSADDQMLYGRASVYGEVKLPLRRISEITVGDFEFERFEEKFGAWSSRPAPEPQWDEGH